jgi:hypothetical protein
VLAIGTTTDIATSTGLAVYNRDIEILPGDPVKVGGADAASSARDVAVAGNYAYVVSNSSGDDLEIFDISDPTNPTKVGGAEAASSAYGVTVAGNYAYLVAGDNSDEGTLEIFDVSDPINPTRVLVMDVVDQPRALQVVGNTLYLTGYADSTSDEFEIYDLGGLITPTAEIGNLLANDIQSDFVRVTQSLVTDGGLNVGTNALIGGSLTITGTASSSLQGSNQNTTLAITSGRFGIGTSTPYAAVGVAGDVALTGALYDSSAETGTDGTVLRSTGTGVEWVPLGAVLSGLFSDNDQITYLTSLTDVLAIGTTTDVATSTGLAVYNKDIEILPGTPTLVGLFDPNDVNILEGGWNVTVSGDYAYVTGYYSDNMLILDISDPTNPTLVGNFDPGVGVLDNGYHVDIVGSYAYVTGGNSDNVAIVDISDPTSPTLVGNWDPNDNNVIESARQILVSGRYAYVTGRDSDNVAIVDISDPTSPTLVGNWDPNNLDTMERAVDIAVDGNYAYVTGFFSDNVAIVDISDPTSPTLVGDWDPNNQSIMDGGTSIKISGNYAYVTGYFSDNMLILDISDPTNPTLVGNFDPGVSILEGAETLTISGQYAYITGWDTDNVVIVNISDPTNPTLAGNFNPNDTNILDEPREVAIVGNYAYVTGRGSDSLAVLNLGGLITPTAEIGNLASNQIETDFMRVTQALVADTSLNVGTNAMIGGTLSITGTASSSLIDGNQLTALSITSGFIEIGTTTATSGIQIGYGAICVDNDGECSATTTGRISSVSSYLGNSDLAETYFSSEPLEPGTIVALTSELSVETATTDSPHTIIGVVSTNPGLLLGFDDTPTRDDETQYPIGLKGRIPVKVSTENGPIAPGDQLMLSSIPGTAMKATGTGAVVGIALEAFDPQSDTDPYYSTTFVNQYLDNLAATDDAATIQAALTAQQIQTVTLPTTPGTSAEGDRAVQTGQIIMFVDLSYRYVDETTTHALRTLMGTTTAGVTETVLDRVVTLGRSFIDGVLSIFALDATQLEVTDELCINGTCIQSNQLRILIERAADGSAVDQVTVYEEDGSGDISVVIGGADGDTVTTAPVTHATSSPTPTATSTPLTSSTTSTTTESTGGDQNTSENGDNAATSTPEIGDNETTASTTSAGGEVVVEAPTASTENPETEPPMGNVEPTTGGEQTTEPVAPQAPTAPASSNPENTAPAPAEEPEPDVVVEDQPEVVEPEPAPSAPAEEGSNNEET